MTDQTKNRNKPTILIAEDSDLDTILLIRAFVRAGISAHYHIVKDGQETVDYLSGEGNFEDRAKHPVPGVLLLDLKMPRMNGFDVLEWVRAHPRLRRLPVVVLTSSDEPKDINRAYDLGANSYVLKPSKYETLQSLASELEKYWCSINVPGRC
jgi:CheY-like chemotaxis protein